MTPERTLELLPVMEHFAEGGKVQFLDVGKEYEEWADTNSPNWVHSTKYRKAPEPRVFYVNFYKKTSLGWSNGLPGFHDTKEQAIKSAVPGIEETAVKFVEVLDETD